MFKTIGAMIKFGLFALVIVIISHMIHWDGETLSDQVKSSMAKAERTSLYQDVTHKSSEIVESIKDQVLPTKTRKNISKKSKKLDEFTDREKLKLREIIRDL